MNNARQRAQRELDRARKALLAAKILMENQLYEDCVSRAYYAVLHAAKAALATKDIEPISHKAVKRMFSLYLVKTGKIEKGLAKILTAEQEDRAIGDYDIYIEIDEDRALKRVHDAEKFVQRIEKYLQT
ncbi:MAG: HEPN domain-containing protein [Sedimentisphaerales bacterium]